MVASVSPFTHQIRPPSRDSRSLCFSRLQSHLLSLLITFFLLHALSWYIRVQKNDLSKRKSLADQNYKYPKFRNCAYLLPILGVVSIGYAVVNYYSPSNSNKILIIVANFDEDQKINLRRSLTEAIQGLAGRVPEIQLLEGVDSKTQPFRVEEKGEEAALEYGRKQLKEAGLHKGLIIWGYCKNEKKGAVFITRINLTPNEIELKSKTKFEGIVASGDVRIEIDVEDKISEGILHFITLLAGVVQYEYGNYVEAINRFNDAENRKATPNELVDPKYLYFFRGSAFIYQHRYLDAVNDLSKAITNPTTNTESNYAEAYNNRALALISLYRFDEAFTDFVSATKLGLDPNLVSINKATALNQTNQPDIAITELTSVIEKLLPLKNSKLLSIAHLYLAQSYSFKASRSKPSSDSDKYLKQSESNIQKSLDLDPENLLAIFFWGDLQLYRGRFDEAIAYYSKLLERKPNDYRFHAQIGFVFLRKGDFDSALIALNKAELLNPNDALNLDNIALTYFSKAIYEGKRDLLDKSIEFHKKAIDVDPNLEGIHYNFGNTLLEKKLYLDAFNEFSEEIHRYPDSPRIALSYLQRGVVCEELVNSEQSGKDFAIAKKINPDVAQEYFDIFTTQYERKNYNEALKCINIVLKLWPNDPKYVVLKGQTLQRLSKWSLAREYYLKALNLNHNDDQTHFNLGVVYQEEGNDIEAIRSYTNAINLRGDNMVDSLTNRGSIFFQKRDYKNALPDFNMAINLDEHEVKAYLMRGQLYLYKGPLENAVFEKAESDFKKALSVAQTFRRQTISD